MCWNSPAMNSPAIGCCGATEQRPRPPQQHRTIQRSAAHVARAKFTVRVIIDLLPSRTTTSFGPRTSSRTTGDDSAVFPRSGSPAKFGAFLHVRVPDSVSEKEDLACLARLVVCLALLGICFSTGGRGKTRTNRHLSVT